MNREAYDVLVYGPDSEDWGGEGLVGPLSATECTYTGEAGGDMTLELQHPYDRAGKWKALQVGNVLKAWIQMQVPPTITAQSMVQTSAEVWTVSTTATNAQRYLYKKSTGRKRYAVLAAGTVVVMVANTASGRYKVKSGKYTGWMERDGLVYSTTVTGLGTETDNLQGILGAVAIKPQYFRIYSVELKDEQVTCDARHISYDLLKNLTRYTATAATPLPTVLSGIFSGCMDTLVSEEWSLQTNLLDTRSGLSWTDVNPIKALLDPDEGCVAKWGCEILRDNTDIYLLDHVGHDRGVRVEYGRNLGGINVSYSTENLATYIMPVGEKKDGTPLYLPEKWIVSDYADDYPQKHIYTFKASDCKIGTNGVTESVALTRMRAQAQAYLDSGCDLPTATVEVEVRQVDSAAGMAIVELLEPLALYDRVTLIDDRMGVQLTERVISVKWDCIHARVLSVTLGAAADSMSSVTLPSWSIDSVNGSKLVGGTVTAGALTSGAINERHIQAESINAQAIQAQAITTDKLTAGAITTDKLAAGAVTAEKADIASITAGVIASESIHTEILTAAQAAVGTANIGYAQIKDASVETLFTKDGNADRYYINKLGVTSAQILNLMVGTLVFKGTDGNFYQLDASTDSDGNVSFAPSAYSGTVDETSGVTADGKRSLFEEVVNVNDLYASTMHAADALITRLRVDQLYANEAFISKLKTVEITGQDGSVRVMGDILDNVTTVLDVETDGVYVRDAHGTNALKLTGESVEIGAENTGGYARFDNDSLQFGNYELRMSRDGGLVFKKKEA